MQNLEYREAGLAVYLIGLLLMLYGMRAAYTRSRSMVNGYHGVLLVLVMVEICTWVLLQGVQIIRCDMEQSTFR